MGGSSEVPGAARRASGIDKVVDGLQARLDALTETLASSQSAVTKATNDSGQVKAELATARATATAFSGARDEADQAASRAKDAIAAAHALIDTLAADDVDRLTSKIAEIETAYQAARAARTDAERSLAEHQAGVHALKTEVARRRAEADAAHAELATLPAEARELAVTVKGLTLALTRDTQAGQALKAFVDRTLLEDAKRRLDESVSEDRVGELAAAYDSAVASVTEARARLESTSAEAAAEQAAVAEAKAAVGAAAAIRTRELEKLVVLQKP
jgi:chromosome segregation ATPase